MRTLICISGLMPTANAISTEAYAQSMQEMGYKDIDIEDLSEDVFPGFTRFLKDRGGGWWAFGSVIDWWARRGMKFVLVSGEKPA